MQKYELFLKHARVRAKKMREKCNFLLFLPENRLLRLILVVNARCFAMSAKTKWRRSSQDFYRMASLAGTFEHLSSRISNIVHFLASLHRLILLHPLYYMGRYGGKEIKIGRKVTKKMMCTRNCFLDFAKPRDNISVYLCPLCKSPRLRAWVFLLKLSVSVFLQSC